MQPQITTLTRALTDATTAVHTDREKADAQFGPGLFDRAIAHHTAQNLRADTQTGRTLNRAGELARFVDYDWGADYVTAPHFVYFDFFRGVLLNSCSRMARGLGA